MQELPATYKAQFFAMVGAEAVIWTPVQYLNFTMLPVQHQQMFVNVVAIIEAAVLSWCDALDPGSLPLITSRQHAASAVPCSCKKATQHSDCC